MDLISFRNLPKLRLLEGVRKQVGEGLGQAGAAAFGLGADGVEVHEPRLEDGPRHRLQRVVHSTIQLDLVVQCAEDIGDGTLLAMTRQRDLHLALVSKAYVLGHVSLARYPFELYKEFASKHPIVEKPGIELLVVQRSPEAQLRRVNESGRARSNKGKTSNRAL